MRARKWRRSEVISYSFSNLSIYQAPGRLTDSSSSVPSAPDLVQADESPPLLSRLAASPRVDHQPTLAGEETAELSCKFTKVGSLLFGRNHILSHCRSGKSKLKESGVDLLRRGGRRIGRVGSSRLLEAKRERRSKLDLLLTSSIH